MSRGRIHAPLLAILALALGAVAVTDAAVLGVAAKRKPAHHKSKPKAANGLKAPRLLSPASGVFVEAMPTLTWSAVKGAVEYEWQVSAESSFRSQIIQRGVGQGTPRTTNLAATLIGAQTDGTYYWRVRGVTKSGKAGAWSSARTFVKHWTQTATLLAPSNDASIAWPSTPLVMRWSAAPHAYEYLVQIATDREFANVVVGSAKSPLKTTGTAYALQTTLPAGRYYWRVTPVDNEEHRGVPSESRSFAWFWPTGTTTSVANVNRTAETFEPEFAWGPVPGAAHYEVQVNSAQEFPAGSMWCCQKEPLTVGTSLTPTGVLPNNNLYYWRVRALDVNGNAGDWNEGETFKKYFDEATPSIPGLTMITPGGKAIVPLAAGEPIETDTPIVTWSPVPGAATYEVQVGQYAGACNWLSPHIYETATLAWTPLVSGKHIGSKEWPGPQSPGTALAEGATYCVRVLARSAKDVTGQDVISQWTYVGGLGQPSFKFLPQPPAAEPASYLLPTQPAESSIVGIDGGCTVRCTRTPLFTWRRIPGASSYYVVIARDEHFTNVVDVAHTRVPAYAPPLGGEEPLDDETTAFYWEVLPVETVGKEELLSEEPLLPIQAFNKSSEPPANLSPTSTTPGQPTFMWSPVEGALNYTLQVSLDPSFKTLLDEVRTDANSYTATKTYPAAEPLFWRVRANDANSNSSLAGLNWSDTRQFTRVLPAPVLSPSNPTSTEVLPVLSWSAVPGATGYEVSLEQPDGTRKEFQTASTSFTPVGWDGPGVWRYKVRALFPLSGGSTVPGPFTPQQSIVHAAAPPPGAIGEKSGTKVVIHWSPQSYAKQYQVAISTTETFRTSVETRKVHTENWAPSINFANKANRGTLYWRVAAVDGRGNVGSYSTGRFVPPKAKPKCTVKKVKQGKRTVKKCVVSKHTKKKARKH